MSISTVVKELEGAFETDQMKMVALGLMAIGAY